MEKEKRLKNLYIRIHKRFPLTMNDLLFLADHDVECYAKTYRHIVLDAPAKRIFHKDIELKEAPISIEEDDERNRVAMMIARMRKNTVNSDVMIGMKPAAVMALIQEREDKESPQIIKYQYYSLIQPDSLLNAQV